MPWWISMGDSPIGMLSMDSMVEYGRRIAVDRHLWGGHVELATVSL